MKTTAPRRSVMLALAFMLAAACSRGASAPANDGETSPSPTFHDAAHVVAPEAFALGPDGVYFSDCAAQRIFRLKNDGGITTVAGSGPESFESGGFSGDGGLATQARLNCPGGLAFDRGGDLLFADTLNNRVRMVDTTGTITTVAGSGPTGLDAGGYTGDGGPATRARFEFPYGLAFDRAGNLYVTDHGNDAIRMVDTAGRVTTIAGTGVGGFSGDGGPAAKAQLHGPWSIAIGGDGDLYFTEKENAVVRRVDGRGVITTVVGAGRRSDPASPKTTFKEPYGLALDSHGDLFVSDDRANLIDKIDPTSGTISTIAGTGDQGSTGDGGPAVDARLNSPFGLLVTPTGSLDVADGGNGCVRAIDPSGVITSLICA